MQRLSGRTVLGAGIGALVWPLSVAMRYRFMYHMTRYGTIASSLNKLGAFQCQFVMCWVVFGNVCWAVFAVHLETGMVAPYRRYSSRRR